MGSDTLGNCLKAPSRMIVDMRKWTLLAILAAPSLALAVDGNLTVSVPALGSTIVVKTSSEFAGAVSSVVFRGKEHIDAADHGRLLQSASSFDGYGECFNPTEGGSLLHSKREATSVLEAARVEGNQLWTRTDMGFWLNPGTPYPNGCGGNKALTHAMNNDYISHHILEKHITAGMINFPNVIRYEVTFDVPATYTKGTFEALTGYMPKDFSHAMYYDIAHKTATDAGTKQGEQPFPVILATPNGSYAMAVYSPEEPQPGYGRFDFGVVEKWNCVFRLTDIKPKPYHFECGVVLGTVQEVEDTLNRLDAWRRHKDATEKKTGS
jgi:hypothetical protein